MYRNVDEFLRDVQSSSVSSKESNLKTDVQVVIPCQITRGRFPGVMNVDEIGLKEKLKKYSRLIIRLFMEDDIQRDSRVASLAVPLGKLGDCYIHPIIDLDLIDKTQVWTKQKLMEFADAAVEVLKQKLPKVSWDVFTRDGRGGGIHLIPVNTCIPNKNYHLFCDFIKNSMTITGWKVDCPSTVTLPGCGKIGTLEYVYKNSANQFEPFPKCNLIDGCCKIDTFKTATDLEETSNLNLMRESEETRAYVHHLHRMTKPMECSSDTAVLYYLLNNNAPEDVQQLRYYRAAESVVMRLRRKDKFEVMFASISEYMMKNAYSICILNNNRHLWMSQLLVDELENTDNYMSTYKVYLLLSLQYPIFNVDDDKMCLYTPVGWTSEDKNNVATFHFLLLNYLKAKTSLDKYGKFPHKKQLDFTKAFWDFKMNSLTHVNPNTLACTSDYYLITKDSSVFVKATLLYPYFSNTHLDYSKKKIEEGLRLFEEKKEKIFFIIDNCHLIAEGSKSFQDLFEDADFLKCPIMSCVYFFITFLMLKGKRVYQFINLLRNIMFGISKRVIFLVGSEGDNGKSTFSIALKAAFGASCGVFNDAEIVNKSNSATSPDFLTNSSKKIIFLDESGDLKFDVNVLKRITSEGLASVRGLYKSTEVVQCRPNFIAMGNSSPNIGVDRALKRRIILFKADSEFVSETDTSMMDVLTRTKKYGIRPRFAKLEMLQPDLVGFGLLIILIGMRDCGDRDLTHDESMRVSTLLDPFLQIFIDSDAEGSFLTLESVKGMVIKFCELYPTADFNCLMSQFHSEFSSRYTSHGVRNMGLRVDAPIF